VYFGFGIPAAASREPRSQHDGATCGQASQLQQEARRPFPLDSSSAVESSNPELKTARAQVTPDPWPLGLHILREPGHRSSQFPSQWTGFSEAGGAASDRKSQK